MDALSDTDDYYIYYQDGSIYCSFGDKFIDFRISKYLSSSDIIQISYRCDSVYTYQLVNDEWTFFKLEKPTGASVIITSRTKLFKFDNSVLTLDPEKFNNLVSNRYLIFSSQDLVYKESGEVFYKANDVLRSHDYQETIIRPSITQSDLIMVTDEVLGILPVVMVTLVSIIGIRKAINFFISLLRSA